MKFTTALLALSTLGAVSAATCSSTGFTGQAPLGDIDAAINIFCGGAGQDGDIDFVSGTDGYSLVTFGSNNIKIFATRTNAANCKDMFNSIKDTCTGKGLKYGRTWAGRDYYAISVYPAGQGNFWP